MPSFDRISSFIRSFVRDDEGVLGEIYLNAVAEGVPVIRPETRELLKIQLLLKNPKNILEIGTAVGYSSLYMSNYIGENSHITTIELDSERAEAAILNIDSMDKSDVINVICGDAAEVLKTLDSEKYDFAFVDAAKGQYINYLPDIIRIIKPEGLIVSDNILQEGEILESHFTVEKRNRTIHDRMREYLYAICNDDRIDTAILSVGDGVALSVKK